MYKDLRGKKQIDIVIDVDSFTCECIGYPTIYEFKDKEGTNYYFRLRHGYARIVCEDTDEILLSDSMNGFDGVCCWNDVIKWSRNNGVLLNC